MPGQDGHLGESHMISRYAAGTALMLCLGASTGASSAQQPADVKVTQKYLVPLCLDGAPVKSGDRRWKLSPTEHSMTFTMKNKPRKGMVATPGGPGIVVIKFTLEAGHKVPTRGARVVDDVLVANVGAGSLVPCRPRPYRRPGGRDPAGLDGGRM